MKQFIKSWGIIALALGLMFAGCNDSNASIDIEDKPPVVRELSRDEIRNQIFLEYTSGIRKDKDNELQVLIADETRYLIQLETKEQYVISVNPIITNQIMRQLTDNKINYTINFVDVEEDGNMGEKEYVIGWSKQFYLPKNLR